MSSYIRNKKGQALLELAIFGSIILMLLGIILNYGLRYGLQQKVMMSAFRKTLAASANPNSGGQGSYTLVQDKHIPNPGNPFAVGSVAPFSASGSVTRSARLHETADTDAELPRTTIQIHDLKFTYKTAGFRDVGDISGAVDKYKEIYGQNNVWEEGSGNYRVIDSVEGELINYDAAVRQCRMIVDNQACVTECERGKSPGSSTDCNGVCSQSMNAWYCENYIRTPNPSGSLYAYSYTFPVLNNIFSFAIAANKPKAMGMQSSYTQGTIMNNILRKEESAGSITTTDNINWATTTKRSVVSIDQLHNVQQAPVSTVVGENTTCVNAECNYGGRMKRKNLIFMLGMIIIFFISGCAQMETDVQLARRIFNGLCKGNQRVQNLIDWGTLKAMGVDVGQSYSNIVSEKERSDYRKVFFYNLSYAFRAAGGDVSKFSDWRVKDRGGDHTVVAADSAMGKAILFTLSNKGSARKLMAIEWQQ